MARSAGHTDAVQTAALAFSKGTLYAVRSPYGSRPLLDQDLVAAEQQQQPVPSLRQTFSCYQLERQLRRGGELHACVIEGTDKEKRIHFVAPVGDVPTEVLTELLLRNNREPKRSRLRVRAVPSLEFRWCSLPEMQVASARELPLSTSLRRWVHDDNFLHIVKQLGHEMKRVGGSITTGLPLPSPFGEDAAYKDRTLQL